MEVLVLNQSHEVLDVRPLSRAMKLIVKGKAHKPSGFEDYHEVKTPDGVMRVPTALVMAYYVHVPHRRFPCTKVNVLRRDGYACMYCGARLTNATGTIDHVLPQSRGGKHQWSNVVAACRDCNGRKDNKTPEEAKMRLICRPHTPQNDVTAIHAIGKHKAWERWIVT